MPLQRPTVQPRSRLAHEAAKWAGRQKRFDEYNLALFQAFFQHGLDIGKQGILKQLAEELDLDPSGLLTSLANETFTPEVLADQEEARQIGVSAVPAFALDGRVIATGVQTVDTLKNLLNLRPL